MTFTPSAQDRERFHSQKVAVLQYLQAGHTITQEEAKAEYGIMRLASRVDELRREGWNVLTTMIPVGENGACVARYSLSDEPRRKSPFLSVVPENIPDELKALPQWVVWQGTKLPRTVEGWNASPVDCSTWTTFERVVEHYAAGLCDGIGFVFAKGGGFVGVDLDKCFDDSGELIPQAAAIVDGLGSYTEYSVSGKGLHVIVHATLKKGWRNGPIEIYPHGRYFTMTGHVLNEARSVQERQAQIDRLVQLIAPEKKTVGCTPRRRYLGNDELIEKAMAAKNGEKFTRLWRGDTAGYPSSSEADLALLSMLLYWTNCDEDRAAVLFSQSGLFRDKWEKRPDYRRRCFEYLRGRMTA